MLELRYFLNNFSSSIPPWEWDEDYPEDMHGKYYPEDIIALVQIEACISEKKQSENK